jgi:hypothetical protein
MAKHPITAAYIALVYAQALALEFALGFVVGHAGEPLPSWQD